MAAYRYSITRHRQDNTVWYHCFSQKLYNLHQERKLPSKYYSRKFNLLGSQIILKNSMVLPQITQKTKSWVVKTFFKIFWGTQFLLWGHWYPCFGLLVTSALGFKARVDHPLLACFVDVHNGFLRFTSGVTPANLLMASMAASHIPYMYVAEVGCWDSIGRPPAQ